MKKYKNSEIRTALIQLGQQRGVEYQLCVVRDVMDAFRFNTEHPVKNQVKGVLDQYEKQRASNAVQSNEVEPVENASPEKIKALRASFNYRGLMTVVAKHIGANVDLFYKRMNGNTPTPLPMYEQVLAVLPDFKKNFIADDMAMLEAKKQGACHYHGRVCRICGDDKRYTLSRLCVSCVRAGKRRLSKKKKNEVAA